MKEQHVYRLRINTLCKANKLRKILPLLGILRPPQHIPASWSPYDLTGGDDSIVTLPVVAPAALAGKDKSKARVKIF
jgi:hypothetical protein